MLNLDFSRSKMLRLCLVCVTYNSNTFHSFRFKLCIMFVHTLKMCTFYFLHISRYKKKIIFGGLELRHFLSSKCLDGLICILFKILLVYLYNKYCEILILFAKKAFRYTYVHIQGLKKTCRFQKLAIRTQV